jgi:ABC-type iron transport system FetAB ATPase subunit
MSNDSDPQATAPALRSLIVCLDHPDAKGLVERAASQLEALAARNAELQNGNAQLAGLVRRLQDHMKHGATP